MTSSIFCNSQQIHGNLQKKCKRIFEDGTVSGFYIGEKNIFAMLVVFDELKSMFCRAYIARINGKLSIYDSDIRFSKHSIERLIQRLKQNRQE
jgi:hypothetical protein